MNLSKEELLKMKKDRVEQKEKLEAIFHQLTGQIAFIDDLLKKEETPKDTKCQK